MPTRLKWNRTVPLPHRHDLARDKALSPKPMEARPDPTILQFHCRSCVCCSTGQWLSHNITNLVRHFNGRIMTIACCLFLLAGGKAICLSIRLEARPRRSFAADFLLYCPLNWLEDCSMVSNPCTKLIEMRTFNSSRNVMIPSFHDFLVVGRIDLCLSRLPARVMPPRFDDFLEAGRKCFSVPVAKATRAVSIA